MFMQEVDVESQDCLQPGKSQQDVKDLHGLNLLAISQRIEKRQHQL